MLDVTPVTEPYPAKVPTTRRRAGQRNAVVIALLCLLLLPVLDGVPAYADKNIDGQVEQAGEAVDEANAAVAKALRTLRRTEAELPQARRAKREAVLKAGRAKVAADEAAAAASRARSELAVTQLNLEQVNQRLAAAADKVDDLARTAYQVGPLSQIEVLLSSSSPQDFSLRLVAVDRMAQSQIQAQRELFASKALLAQQEVRAGALAEEAEAQERKATEQLVAARQASQAAATAEARVSQIAKQRAKALRKARANSVAVAQRYRALKREQARIKRAARQAARQANGADDSQAGPAGELLWPISGGGISDRPGPRVHPVYGYRSCHTGIDITGGTGTPIRAAAAGTVADITRGGPYGLATLVAHGNGMTTFYAHQSSVRVNVGDRVEAGEVIGEVGTSGWVTGPHLHFEVRLDGDAYDPMGWFGKAKEKVRC